MANTGSTGITAIVGNGVIVLEWDVVDEATGYIVKNGDGTVQYNEQAQSNNFYTIDNLTNGTEYTFKVYAYVNSKWVEVYTVTQIPEPYPQNVKAVAGTGKVTIIWNEVADIYGYVIKSADNKVQYTPKTINETSYTITGLMNGTEYSFIVYAGDGADWFGSAVVSATPFVEDCFITRRGRTYTNYTIDDNGLFRYPSKVVIPSNVTVLQNSIGSFYTHTEIVELSLESNSNLYTIAQNGLNGCTSLKRADFSNRNGNIRLASYAFYNDSVLEEMFFNESTKIELSSPANAFAYCKSLTDDTINEVLERASRYSTTLINCGNMFMYCTNLVDIIIPEGITNIQACSAMFSKCTGLTSVTFPSTLQKFWNSNQFFADCTSLKTIIFKSVIDTTGAAISISNANSIFTNCTALETIIVPEGWNVPTFISNGTAAYSNNITKDCMINMFNNLAIVDSGTITLGATNLARLSDEEKAIATNKGWTLA